MAEGLLKSLGYAQYGPSTGVRTLADAPSQGVQAPSNAYQCWIVVEAQAIRWRDDPQGTNPTASVGMLQKPTDPPLHYMGDIDKFKWIEAVAGAVVNVVYYSG